MKVWERGKLREPDQFSRPQNEWMIVQWIQNVLTGSVLNLVDKDAEHMHAFLPATNVLPSACKAWT